MGDISNDIKKYLRGELTAAEMHALERKALSDPFLAEALEGAGSIAESNFQDDLSGLQASIRKRVARSDNKTITWNWPLRIAAGLLLVAVSSYIVVSLTDESLKEETKLALNKKEENQSEKSAPAEGQALVDSVPPSNDQPKENNPSVHQARRMQAESSATSPTSSPMDHVAQEPPVPVTATEVAPVVAGNERSGERAAVSDESSGGLSGISAISKSKKDEAEAKVSDLDDQVKEAPAVRGALDNSRDEILSKRRSRSKESPTRSMEPAKGATTLPREQAVLSSPNQFVASKPSGKIVSGKVVDAEDGSPMPGVDIIVKGTTRGTVSDLRGNYEIALTEKDSSLVFSFIGLQSKEVSVDNTEHKMDVSLSPDLSQLSEVVVVGYAPDATDKEEDTSWQMAEPEGGRKEYKKYLEKNMTYPEQALQNKVEGRVTAQFTIEPNGQLTDFRVTKSLGYGCDEEVIRLIKQGPAWVPSKRNAEPVKGKIKVKMRFLLPENRK